MSYRSKIDLISAKERIMVLEETLDLVKMRMQLLARTNTGATLNAALHMIELIDRTMEKENEDNEKIST